MRLSTPEVTALDLVLMPRRGGGLSNVATILGEMVRDAALDPGKLAELATRYPIAVAQRTGWLLEFVANEVGQSVNLVQLLKVANSRTTPALLETSGPRRGPLDERWNVIVNGSIEPDL